MRSVLLWGLKGPVQNLSLAPNVSPTLTSLICCRIFFSLAQPGTAATVSCYLDWHQKSLSTITATLGGGILKGFGLMFLQLYPSSAKRNWWCFLTDPTDFRLSCFIGKLTPVSTHLILLINPDPWGKKWWFDVCYKSITILQCNTERKWEERLIADKRETILVLLQLSRQLIILSLSVHQQIIFWFDQLIV